MMEHDETPSVDDAALAAGDGITPHQAADGAALSRVDELIREKQHAEMLAQRSMSEAAALRRQGQAPRAADYAQPEEFTRAVAGQAVREAGADLFARQAAQAQETAARAAQEAWAESTAAFRQKAPDFDTVAHNPHLPVTPIMADAIRESRKGAEIAYFLGKNPGEAAKIASLPPVSQATAIARLEARVASSPSAVSQAPQPFSVLTGGSGAGGKRLEDMDFEQYRRARGF